MLKTREGAQRMTNIPVLYPILLAQKKCAANANQVLGAQEIKVALLERPGSTKLDNVIWVM